VAGRKHSCGVNFRQRDKYTDTQTVAIILIIQEMPMSTDDKATQQPKTPYKVKNVKYGEKVVRGRVIGRNKTVIPEEQVAELARLHCTTNEMADFFDVPRQTFVDNFRDIIQKNKLETKQRLRAAQLKLALNGDRSMLIWLGKNILGQSDQPINKDEDQVLPWLDESDNSQS